MCLPAQQAPWGHTYGQIRSVPKLTLGRIEALPPVSHSCLRELTRWGYNGVSLSLLAARETTLGLGTFPPLGWGKTPGSEKTFLMGIVPDWNNTLHTLPKDSLSSRLHQDSLTASAKMDMKIWEMDCCLTNIFKDSLRNVLSTDYNHVTSCITPTE